MALAESDGRGESTAPETEFVSPPPPPVASRRRRVTSTVLLVLGLVISALSLMVLYACWHDDRDITNHIGRADADVLSVVYNRTAVRFVTPDGTVYIPPDGVLYPEGLAAGERVKVEYDTLEPNMVRVAGRDFTLAFLPVGTTIAGTWVVVGPLLWWLRRPKRS
ncbi:MAG TPA: DUF3592 domain-containing protein [Pseudonocardiaceae bacterium]